MLTPSTISLEKKIEPLLEISGFDISRRKKSIFFFRTSRPVLVLANSFVVGGQDIVLGAIAAGG